MRKKIVAGNWKMNLDWQQAQTLHASLQNVELGETEVILFPSALYLSGLAQLPSSAIKLGAQNAYPKDSGAFTGEQSFAQLKSIGAQYVLVGHSERREYFNEDATFLKEKVDASLNNGITPIFCCGEPLNIRESGNEVAYVTQQIEDSLYHLSATGIVKCVLAYEPIWAIGTGLTATADQAEEMHANIRQSLATKYGQDVADSISILYGGSCNENNAKELFSRANVDGGLIGGASLKSEAFAQIIQAF